GAPMSPVSGSPDAASNEVHADLAYWMFVNSYDGESYQTNLEDFINENFPEMTNARASLFDSNQSFIWPYNQFDQPEQNTPLLQCHSYFTAIIPLYRLIINSIILIRILHYFNILRMKLKQRFIRTKYMR